MDSTLPVISEDNTCYLYQIKFQSQSHQDQFYTFNRTVALMETERLRSTSDTVTMSQIHGVLFNDKALKVFKVLQMFSFIKKFYPLSEESAVPIQLIETEASYDAKTQKREEDMKKSISEKLSKNQGCLLTREEMAYLKNRI